MKLVPNNNQLDSYYINNIFENDLHYHDIEIDAGYAILISDYSHRIIAHSIFTENVIDSVNNEMFRTNEPNLIKLKVFRQSNVLKDSKGQTINIFTDRWWKN